MIAIKNRIIFWHMSNGMTQRRGSKNIKNKKKPFEVDLYKWVVYTMCQVKV